MKTPPSYPFKLRVTSYKLRVTSYELRTPHTSYLIPLFAFCFLLFCFSAFTQNPNCYRITFSDKNNSPYSVNRPEEFLSQRAIAKRERFNIPVIEQDLPVNPQYLEAILTFSSEPSQIISNSKWDNSVVIFYPETENCHPIIADMINSFSFVIDTLPVAYYKLPLGKSIHKGMPTNLPKADVNLYSSCDYDYGNSIENINIHNGQFLHKAGFCGEEMLICAIDGEWDGFDTISYFKPLYQNGQIWGTRDLVPGVNNVYFGKNGHGTFVTSEMASAMDGKMVGSAPKANYYFIRPENVWSEQLVEEDFWAYAAEIADSLGADVVTSSVGYIYFDYEWQNLYTQEDNNGISSIASRSASILAQKGVIVVKSAGNEGITEWHYITRPADAFNILAVGMVSPSGVVDSWSSYGPSADGRIKPDVASVGAPAWGVFSDGSIGKTGGTSMAAPIIAGLSACLWQALPQYSALELMQLIREYGDSYNNPNDRIGYGIPDFYQCYLDHHIGVMEHKASDILVYPNPTTGNLRVTSYKLQVTDVELFDVYGRKQKAECRKQNAEWILDLSNLKDGIYFVIIKTENSFVTKKIVKY